MLHWIFRLIYLLMWLFDIALLVYVLLSWLHPAANRWTEMLRQIVEPVLKPIRAKLMRVLPTRWQIVDWSPMAAWLLMEIARWLLQVLEGILL